MKFSGRLQIEADPVQWLKTDLSMAQGRLELISGAEVLGSWSMTQVKAERIEGDRFELLLGDDRALFAADDALAFSYEALPHLTKKHILTGPTGLRGRLRQGRRGSERHEAEQSNVGNSHAKGTETVEPVVPERVPTTVEGDAPNHPVAHRLRELIQAANQERALQELAAAEAPDEIGPDEIGPDEIGPDEIGPDEIGPEKSWPEKSWPEKSWPEASGTDRDEFVVDAWAEPGDSATAEQASSDLASSDLASSDVDPIESPKLFQRVEVDTAKSEIGRSEIGQIEFEEIDLPALGPSDLESIELEAAELANDFWARPTDLPPEPPRHDTVRSPKVGKLDLEPAFAKASGPAGDDPETRVMIALEGILAEVRNGSLSPAQVSAVTDLVEAVTDFVGARRSTGN